VASGATIGRTSKRLQTNTNWESMDEAVGWAERAPFEALSPIYPGEYGATGEIEIRQVFEPGSL
jgi:hypothetical protein